VFSVKICQSQTFEEQWLYIFHHFKILFTNPLTPNDHYIGRTAPLTSKRYILYIYSTNIGTEYFKRGIYSASFSLQNAVCFIILTYLVLVLFTFYIQSVLNFKKIIPAPKGLATCGFLKHSRAVKLAFCVFNGSCKVMKNRSRIQQRKWNLIWFYDTIFSPSSCF